MPGLGIVVVMTGIMEAEAGDPDEVEAELGARNVAMLVVMDMALFQAWIDCNAGCN